jgi:hypothetical protein
VPAIIWLLAVKATERRMQDSVCSQGRKAFFFEKKKQKTFVHEVRDSTEKSFLVLFFKKELFLA